MLDKSILEGKVISELQTIAESLGVQGHQRMRKGDLIQAIVDRASQDGDGRAVASAPDSASAEAGGGVATEVDTADRAESPNGEAAVADARTEAPAEASG